MGGHEFIISAVSTPFKEYEGTEFAEDDGTGDVLRVCKEKGWVDYLADKNSLGFADEKTARNAALRPLLDVNCDWVILVDSDEFYTTEEIKKITEILEKDKFTTWYKFSLKNYVFSKKEYLSEPFQPPRAYRVVSGGYQLHSFRFDNEVLYGGRITRDLKPHEQFPSKTIQPNIVWTKHLTWLSNERGKSKAAYQIAHFGKEYCSYLWNEEKNSLVFNPEYFTRFNKPLPEVIKEE